MSLRILHLLSQTEVTGAETYAATLANAQIEKGDQVWVMSDTWHTATKAKYQPLSLDNRSFKHRLKNVFAVRQFIRENKIDIVHAHSRASIWVGYFAVKGFKVPLISTIHGRQKPSLSKTLFDFYGDEVICVCKNAKLQLQRAVKINSKKISIIPNGFEFISSDKARQQPLLTIAGRASGPKGTVLSNIICHHLKSILTHFPQLSVQIVGVELSQLSEKTQHVYERLRQEFDTRISCLGFVKDLQTHLVNSSCVIAAGRIAIEALAHGTPVIAVGEAFNLGLITEENIGLAMDSNFGDMATSYETQKICLNNIATELKTALQQDTQQDALRVRDGYAITNVVDKIQQLYQAARMNKVHPRHIPVLMYHKVLVEAENSQHKIYVTQKQFALHMSYLAKRGFTPITFKDYFAFREGNYLLSQFPRKPIFITFDDGYKNNLDNALPILHKHQFKAVLFALGDMELGCNQWDVNHGEPKHELMNAEQLKQIHQHGIEIGAHSMSHPDLTQLPSEQVYQELIQAKSNLEKLIGESVISFAYPYGYYNESVANLVKKTGFKCAVATDTGGLLLEDDLFRIFRVNIMPRDKLIQIWKKTSSWYRHRYWSKRGQ